MGGPLAALSSGNARLTLWHVCLQQVSSLKSDLPALWASSVHVAMDTSRLDLLRVLILPGQDTPYANGAFLFDILLPEHNPSVPPKVCVRELV